MGEVYRALIEPLRATGIDYMVTGGMAVALYGRPRLTDDIDVVVRADAATLPLLHRAYAGGDYAVPPLDALLHGLPLPWKAGFHVQHRPTELRAHFHVAHDTLHDWGFARRREAPLGDGNVWFVPLEYLLIRKLDANRTTESDHHLDDVLAILRARPEDIDMETMDRLAGERSLQTLWKIMRLNADNPRLRRMVDPER